MLRSVSPKRAPLLALLPILFLSACAGTTGSAGGSCDLIPVVEYTQEQSNRLADEVQATASTSMIRAVFADYIALRRLVRACKTPAPE